MPQTDPATPVQWMHALDAARRPETDPAEWARFVARVEAEAPRLTSLLTRIYGAGLHLDTELAALVDLLATSWQQRPAELRALDDARLAEPDWFQSNQML
ncbi:MAG: amylosucrase, partial [Microbacteriaceae bacterium]|nr:amylosucrase [Microbacteriaceae bacterium]